MPTSTKVKNLNINELTEAQYDAAVQGGVIGANELSVLTDVSYVEPSDLATVATTGDYSDLINRPTNLVSTNTAQTISGMKTFSGDITLSGTTSIKNNTGGTNYTMLYRDATTIHVGASTSVLKLEGSGTRPAYNSDSLALLSDVTGGLPDQTGQSGKFLTTDGTDASWSDKPLVNNATGVGSVSLIGVGTTQVYSVNIGNNSQANATATIGIGFGAKARGSQSISIGRDSENDGVAYNSIAIGYNTKTSAEFAIQLGGGGQRRTNSDANTFKVGNNNGNYEMMSADGTIPHARLTNAVQSTTVTIATTDWSSNTASVTVSGLTVTSVVWVAPDNASQSAYTTAGVYASSQSSDTLVFNCVTTPTSALTINVVWC